MSIVFEVEPDPREGGVAYDTEISDEYPKSNLPYKSKFEFILSFIQKPFFLPLRRHVARLKNSKGTTDKDSVRV